MEAFGGLIGMGLRGSRLGKFLGWGISLVGGWRYCGFDMNIDVYLLDYLYRGSQSCVYFARR